MRLTLQQVQQLDGYKPRCRYCHVGCDTDTREWRGMRLCPPCYQDLDALEGLVLIKNR